MSGDVRELVKEHHAFYEVTPYNLVVQENPGKLPVKNRTIKAGFDVDIYGINTKKDPLLPGPDYSVGYAEVQRFAKIISNHTTDFCSLEVISFPSKIVVGGSSHNQLQGTLRIRIAHHRGPDQPAGPAEEQALKELETQLQELGVARR